MLILINVKSKELRKMYDVITNKKETTALAITILDKADII